MTEVGHELCSCTQEIKAVTVTDPQDPSRRITLVDTPGFDDTWANDLETLRGIVDWLERR